MSSSCRACPYKAITSDVRDRASFVVAFVIMEVRYGQKTGLKRYLKGSIRIKSE